MADFENIAHIFKENDHALARCFLSLLIQEFVAYPELLELYLHIIICFHDNRVELFLSCFKSEVRLKQMSVVMREQTPAVFVMRDVLKPFHKFFLGKSSSLMKFAMGKQICDFEQNPSTIAALLTKLKNGIKKLFDLTNFPLVISSICFSCVEIYEHSSIIQKEEGLCISHWVIASVMFLRFLVPMFTSHKDIQKKKGLLFVGKFLMKLCCGGHFDENEIVLNNLLDECSTMYDEFCTGVILKGKLEMVWPNRHYVSPSNQNLSRFCKYLMDWNIQKKIHILVKDSELDEQIRILHSFDSFKRLFFPTFEKPSHSLSTYRSFPLISPSSSIWHPVSIPRSMSLPRSISRLKN